VRDLVATDVDDRGTDFHHRRMTRGITVEVLDGSPLRRPFDPASTTASPKRTMVAHPFRRGRRQRIDGDVRRDTRQIAAQPAIGRTGRRIHVVEPEQRRRRAA